MNSAAELMKYLLILGIPLAAPAYAMRAVKCYAIIGIILVLQFSALRAEDIDHLAPWRSEVRVEPVVSHTDRHVIHSYFNTCPESPNGKYVVYFTSEATDGESGDIRVLDRGTGKERILAANIIAEDAHRVACQQWSNGGKTVVYHNCRDRRWHVMAVDLATNKTRILAKDRQIAFGSPTSPWMPIYGCHWNPGKHRDLELVNVVTGEIKTAVTLVDVLSTYGEWVKEEFGTTDVSIFFPVMSQNGQRVFFKMARPSGGIDFRRGNASHREGKIVYDLEEQRFIRMFETWGHPSWSPDGHQIFEKGNVAIDVNTGKSRRFASSCFSNHPSIAPHGRLFVTDANVTKRKLGNPGDWAIAVGSTTRDDFVVLDIFGNTGGAKSWRPSHPHPVFSADGRRIYYNVNESPWTTLMVATAGSL
jgi:hypothetical protein